MSKSLRTCGMPGANIDQASGTMKVIIERTATFLYFFRGRLSKTASATLRCWFEMQTPSALLYAIHTSSEDWLGHQGRPNPLCLDLVHVLVDLAQLWPCRALYRRQGALTPWNHGR